MCGRYTLKTPVEALAKRFEVKDVSSVVPSYNIAPTQEEI
jgi:putative SOS response-associated peptidase YedK